MPPNTEVLKQLYELFNARDMDALLAMMHMDIQWANGMEGGYVHGHDGVRDYWTRQWAMINARVEPLGFPASGNQRTDVDVHQIVRDLTGGVLSDKVVRHVFHFEDGLIRRFDIN